MAFGEHLETGPNRLVWRCMKCGNITPRHPDTTAVPCGKCDTSMKKGYLKGDREHYRIVLLP